MRFKIPQNVREDAHGLVAQSMEKHALVNVPALAQYLQLRNLVENVALEDLEHLVIEVAEHLSAGMVFNSASTLIAGMAENSSEGGSVLS